MVKLPKAALPKPIVKGLTVFATDKGWVGVDSKGRREILVHIKDLDKYFPNDVEGSVSVVDEEPVQESIKTEEPQSLLEDEFSDLSENVEPKEIKEDGPLTLEKLNSMDWAELKKLGADNEVTGRSRDTLVEKLAEVLGLKE
jgi:hypothetical protein